MGPYTLPFARTRRCCNLYLRSRTWCTVPYLKITTARLRTNDLVYFFCLRLMCVLVVTAIFSRQSRTAVRSFDQKTPRLDYNHQAAPKAIKLGFCAYLLYWVLN